MNKKMNSNSMEHVQKQHFSFIQEWGEPRLKCSTNLTICSLTIVF